MDVHDSETVTSSSPTRLLDPPMSNFNARSAIKLAITRAQSIVETNYGTSRGFVRMLLGQLDFVTGRLDRHANPEVQRVRRLVFVCLGNINRSAFAEAVARKAGANAFSIGLATTTGAPAFHTAVRIASDFGIDLSEHAATSLADYEFQAGDLLLVMEIRHAKRLVERGFPSESIALLGNWSSPHRIHLHDPATLSEAYFKTCFTLIHSAVGNLTARLRSAGSPCISP